MLSERDVRTLLKGRTCGLRRKYGVLITRRLYTLALSRLSSSCISNQLLRIAPRRLFLDNVVARGKV